MNWQNDTVLNRIRQLFDNLPLEAMDLNDSSCKDSLFFSSLHENIQDPHILLEQEKYIQALQFLLQYLRSGILKWDPHTKHRWLQFLHDRLETNLGTSLEVCK